MSGCCGGGCAEVEPNEDEDATYYELLGVTPDVDDTNLKRAYKKQALRWHPDKCDEPNAEEVFKRISHAYHVLSDDGRRAAYDVEMAHGDSYDSFHMPTYHGPADAAAAYNAWQEFCQQEERERAAMARKERRWRYGVVVFVVSLGVLLVAISFLAPSDSTLLFPPPLELTNKELAKYPLDLDLKGFTAKLAARHRARTSDAAALVAQLGGLGSALEAVGLLRTHTPYLRLLINRSSEVRRAPEGVGPRQRGWLLVSQSQGEDIYGRPLNLVSNLLMHMPGEAPSPWPAKALCARLLRSGDIKRKEWWPDLSRAVGGRLRPFALAMVPASECEPEVGLWAIGAATAAAVLATTLTMQQLT